MSEAFIKKNVKLSLEFDDYLVKHPKLFADIPNGAYIVITLSNDNKFNTESLSLIKDRRRKKVVEAHKTGAAWSVRPLQPLT
jgi:hypothetical protein